MSFAVGEPGKPVRMFFDGHDAEVMAQAAAREGEVVGQGDAGAGLTLASDGSFSAYTPPPPSLDSLKASARDQVSAQKAAHLASMQYTTGGQAYTVTLAVQDQLDVQLQLALLQAAGEGATVRWEIVDGVFLTWAATDLQALQSAGVTHVRACYDNADSLFAEVAAAADAASLAAVDPTQGWPA